MRRGEAVLAALGEYAQLKRAELPLGPKHSAYP
jgi:hypothetical protein